MRASRQRRQATSSEVDTLPSNEVAESASTRAGASAALGPRRRMPCPASAPARRGADAERTVLAAQADTGPAVRSRPGRPACERAGR